MGDHLQAVISGSVRRLLKPLVRLLLKYGVPFQAFAELAKQVYVEVAEEDFTIPGRKQTHSRIAVVTGLTRKEVARLQNQPDAGPDKEAALYNRATRVISGWMRDVDFHSKAGEPRPLAVDGESGSFRQLVERYSGDMPVRSTLDELVRTGAVTVDEKQFVHLVSPAYIPATGEAEKLAILGVDAADLMATISHNIECGPDETHFQLKVSYDNLPEEAIPEFQEMSDKHSFELLKLYDKWLASHDRGSAPCEKGESRYRAGVGIYYFQESLDPEGGEK